MNSSETVDSEQQQLRTPNGPADKIQLYNLHVKSTKETVDNNWQLTA